MIRDNKTQKIDELVEAVLKQMGLYQKFKEREVCNVWPEVVGQMIASRTKSVSISEGQAFCCIYFGCCEKRDYDGERRVDKSVE